MLATEPTVTTRQLEWHLATRVAFRFVFAFALLFFVPEPFEVSTDWVTVVSPDVVPWIASHVLHETIPHTRHFVTIGDSYYTLARTMLMALLAAITMVVWSIFDRRRRHYRTLYSCLRVYLRIVLGVLLLSYGCSKIIYGGQFKDPPVSTLLVRLGDLPRMAILWAFMGSSRIYTFFSGLVEVAAGALLFLPRVETIGALIGAAAMTNVFLLDLSYDVNVKTGSLSMLLAAIFLLAPDLRRIADVLVFNRAVPPREERMLFHRVWPERVTAILMAVFGCYWLGSFVTDDLEWSKSVLAIPARTPYYGVWSVDAFTLNGIDRPPLFTDDLRWRLVVFDWEANQPKASLVVEVGSGSHRLFSMDFDRAKKLIALVPWTFDIKGAMDFVQQQPPPPAPIAHLSVNDAQPDQLVLDGDFEGQQIHAVLHRAASPAVHPWRFRWVQTGPRWGEGVIM